MQQHGGVVLELHCVLVRAVWGAHPQSLADKKKDVTDEDVLALVSDEVHQPEKLWDLLGLQVHPPPSCVSAMHALAL